MVLYLNVHEPLICQALYHVISGSNNESCSKVLPKVEKLMILHYGIISVYKTSP